MCSCSLHEAQNFQPGLEGLEDYCGVTSLQCMFLWSHWSTVHVGNSKKLGSDVNKECQKQQQGR